MVSALKSLSLLLVAIVVSALVAGCAQPTPTPQPTNTTAPTATPAPAPTATKAPAAATTPASSGAPSAAGQVEIAGLVGKPMTISVNDLKAKAQTISAADSSGNKQDYQGVRLNKLLSDAQVKAEAKSITVSAADGYKAEIQMADLKGCADCMLSIDSKGAVNSVMPGMAKNTSVKNVAKIEVK